MSKFKILSSNDGQAKFRIKYEAVWHEYKVEVWRGNTCDEEDTCFTDDKDDAIGTQAAMLREYNDKHPV